MIQVIQQDASNQHNNRLTLNHVLQGLNLK